MKNESITPTPVPAHWSRLSTPALCALPRQLRDQNVYNRDTILELACALADRVEEFQRLVEMCRRSAR